MSGAGERFLHGPENFLIVARGLFPVGVLRRLRERIAARRAAISARDERSRQAEEVGVAPDALRLHEEWYEIWKAADVSMFRSYVPAFSEILFPPQIRTVRDMRALVPWHQDATYMESLGNRAHAEVITCHIPLDDDSERRPTLQFCLDPDQRPVRALVRRDAVFNQFDVGENDVPAAEKCRTFQTGLGDAFIFGKHVMHRTYVASDAFRERNSMEFRLTTSKALLPEKDYFNLDTMAFHRTAQP